MIIYIETNFLLEIAYGQEQFTYAQQILRLAEKGRIKIVMSAFSLIEPYWAIKHRSNSRKALAEAIVKEHVQMKRCIKNGKEEFLLNETGKALIDYQKAEFDNFEKIINDFLKICEVTEITKEIFEQSLAYKSQYELEAQDALIYASLVKHMNGQASDTKCFLNRNSKDFNKPEIKDELDELNCRLIASFEAGLNYIESEL